MKNQELDDTEIWTGWASNEAKLLSSTKRQLSVFVIPASIALKAF